MLLSDEDITKFQALYREELGIEISTEDAYEKGAKLLRLLSVVYRPMTSREYALIQKRRQETLPLLEQRLKDESEDFTRS